MVTPRLHSEIYFQGRGRALQFARAYANLHRPARLRVLDETGEVEAEEIFEEHSPRSRLGDAAGAEVVKFVSPSS